MVTVAAFNENFFERYERETRLVVLYGAGKNMQKFWDCYPKVDYICDQNADSIRERNNVKVIAPEKLSEFEESLYIVITIRNPLIAKEVIHKICSMDIEAIIFQQEDNIAFCDSFWESKNSYEVIENRKKLKVNIVCADSGWIFKKFADRMKSTLEKNNVEVTISSQPREDVDINHHIPYVAYAPKKNDTLMITHVDNIRKIELLKKQLNVAGMGICMSKDTLAQLVSCGVDRGKLCYINPAHDGVIRPHKYLIGITHKCHEEDLRKRSTALLDVLAGVNAEYFKFFIMGAGWQDIVLEMTKMGFEVEYYEDFIYDTYNMMMQRIDYFMYMGFDEGTMGYLDALAAGAGTIVTPQGYHLDVDCEIDYPCRTVKQFTEAFLELQHRREVRIKAVEEWTWENYTLKHLEIWNYLLRRKSLKELYVNQSNYEDGIFSVMLEDNRV